MADVFVSGPPVPEMSAKKVIFRMENCGHLPAEYWDALSASLRKLEIVSGGCPQYFHMQVCSCPHGWVRMSAKSAWMGADIRRARGSVRVATPAV